MKWLLLVVRLDVCVRLSFTVCNGIMDAKKGEISISVCTEAWMLYNLHANSRNHCTHIYTIKKSSKCQSTSKSTAHGIFICKNTAHRTRTPSGYFLRWHEYLSLCVFEGEAHKAAVIKQKKFVVSLASS